MCFFFFFFSHRLSFITLSCFTLHKCPSHTGFGLICLYQLCHLTIATISVSLRSSLISTFLHSPSTCPKISLIFFIQIFVICLSLLLLPLLFQMRHYFWHFLITCHQFGFRQTYTTSTQACRVLVWLLEQYRTSIQIQLVQCSEQKCQNHTQQTNITWFITDTMHIHVNHFIAGLCVHYLLLVRKQQIKKRFVKSSNRINFCTIDIKIYQDIS